ncbi:MAG: DUF4430 domain-containing protein [Eubacteriales bacterium]|nr:DUF4430 domain-containing protein [Eubacteriales bacterium]
MKFIKGNRNKIIGAVVVLILLVFTFWYGNGTKESRGFVTGSTDKKSIDRTVSSGQDIGNDRSVQTKEDKQAGQNIQIDEESMSGQSSQTETAERLGGDQTETSSGQKAELNGQENTGSISGEHDMDGNKETDSNQVQKPDNGEAVQTYSCTISISCANILDNIDQLKENKKGLVPANGWILEPVIVEFTKGETVFEVLRRVCRQKNIHMEASKTPMYGTMYIEGINNLYQFDCGSMSGWLYKINANSVNVGSDAYILNDKDVIEWKYTCRMGDI